MIRCLSVVSLTFLSYPSTIRLWLNDGPCVGLRPEHNDHVWSYDFVLARTSDGRAFRILTQLDEFTRECLATSVSRRVTSQDVIDQLFQLFVLRLAIIAACGGCEWRRDGFYIQPDGTEC
jgi:transposase InsO family protein